MAYSFTRNYFMLITLYVHTNIARVFPDGGIRNLGAAMWMVEEVPGAGSKMVAYMATGLTASQEHSKCTPIFRAILPERQLRDN